MKKLLLSVATFLCLNSANAQTPQWIYANSIGAVQSTDSPTYTVKDAAGNLYVASNFGGTHTFGPSQETSSGFYDAYIVKYDATGAFAWFRKFGAVSTFTQCGGLAVDPAGNIYMVGTFTYQIVLGGVTYTTTGNRDLFLVKLDPTGGFMWGKTAGGTSGDEVFSMSLSGNKLFVTGDYNAGFTDGTVTLPAPAGNEDVFVASYNTANGNCENMISCGGSLSDVAFGVSASNNGIYVTGYFIGTANFNGTTLISTNTQPPNPTPTPDMFLMKLDSTLTQSWVIKAGASGTDQGNSISQDAAGNVYVAGYFLRTVNFGNGITLVEANGYGDGFIVKYNSAGVCQWGQKISSGVSDVAATVSTDPQGSSYVGGSFGASASLTGANSSTTTLVTTGATDGFIAKWGTDGTLRWAVKAGSTSDDRTQAITYDNVGYCQFVINYSGSITPGTLGTFLPPGGGSFGQLVASINGFTVGLQNPHNNINVGIYPNPVSNGSFTIESAEPIRYAGIYSLDGKLVSERVFIGLLKTEYSIHDVVPGQYVLMIETEKGTVNRNITIQ